jgi:hypothetical protein
MPSTDKISPLQLRAVQTLFALYARHSLEAAAADPREARLAWASQNLGHQVASFADLRGVEAAKLIETLKRSLGQEVKPPIRRTRDRQTALALGTHGRRGRSVEMEILAGPEEIAAIERLRERLGMTREDFESFLRSRSSPIGRRGGRELRTVSDCNRVRWALKNMLKRVCTRSSSEPRLSEEEAQQ